MKRFIIIGHRASTDGSFNLNDLCGSAGRLDVLIRCIGAALLLSNDIRRDVEIYLLLLGKPRPPICISVSGATVRYLNPDERSTGALLRNALLKGDIPEDGFLESSPGIGIGSMGLAAVLDLCMAGRTRDEVVFKGNEKSKHELPCLMYREKVMETEKEMETGREMGTGKIKKNLSGENNDPTDRQGDAPRLFYLREDGDDIFRIASRSDPGDACDFSFGANPVFILGDDRDLTREEEEIVLASGPEILSLGPRALHTNQCIVIVHNMLDRSEETVRGTVPGR